MKTPIHPTCKHPNVYQWRDTSGARLQDRCCDCDWFVRWAGELESGKKTKAKSKTVEEPQ